MLSLGCYTALIQALNSDDFDLYLKLEWGLVNSIIFPRVNSPCCVCFLHPLKMPHNLETLSRSWPIFFSSVYNNVFYLQQLFLRTITELTKMYYLKHAYVLVQKEDMPNINFSAEKLWRIKIIVLSTFSPPPLSHTHSRTSTIFFFLL